MLILGIDTATPQVSVAIGGHEGVLAATRSARGRQHAEILAPSIEHTCRQARIELSEVAAVAVDVGPGLFTGLRVGVATAKAMAHALGVPMVGVTSLDLLAMPVRFTGRLVLAAVDARRGEVFFAFYRQVPGGMQRISELQVGSPEQVASEVQARGGDALAVGDGVLAHRSTFASLTDVEVADGDLAFPNASTLVHLAHPRALREEFVQPWDLEPLYLRKPDVDIGWPTR